MNEERSYLVEVMAEAQAKLAAGKPLRRSLPGGRLHIDRPLPFLAVHRRRDEDRGTPSLLYGQGSYLIAGPDMPAADITTLLRAVVEPLADRFGSFLVIEIWSSGTPEASGSSTPTFRVLTELQEGDVPNTAQIMEQELRSVGTLHTAADVELESEEPVCPPDLNPLLTDAELRELGCVLLGLEVPAIYHDSEKDHLYPEVLRELTRDISGVIHKVAFDFAQMQTRFEPKDFRVLGRREVLSRGWDVDRRLTELGSHLNFLLNVTPINVASAWERFQAEGFERAPVFHYRPLPFDPDLMKRELFGLEVERVEDPTLAFLLREKRNELDRLVTMLEDRESPRFLQSSLALYGGVEPPLEETALRLLSRSRAQSNGSSHVDPESFAERATEEIAAYREIWPDLEAKVEVRDDVPGVMVVHGALLVGADAQIAEHRIEALVQHEVGTHIVTAQNGRAQPLSLLTAGLPGYEETQEGLAVLAEYLAGGLGVDRLRILAGRVIAVSRMIDGASFVEVFRELTDRHAFEPHKAWQMTMRVFRSGGLSKDAIYLRGLQGLLKHLADGGALSPLFVGKMPLEHVPLVEELMWREVLEQPPLKPLWLQVPGARERLDSARRGLTLDELIDA